jgi:hypothetical protein
LIKDASGNLGLGVTPSAWGSQVKPVQIASAGAQISGSTTGYSGSNWLWLGNNSYMNSSYDHIYSRTAAATLYQQNASTHAWFNAPSGTAGNAITFTQAMTLSSDGNFFVGTTNQIATSKMNIFCSNLAATIQGIGIKNGANQNFGAYLSFVNYQDNLAGSITQSGTTAVAYNTSSDYRLKNTITPMTGALEKVALLKPCTYKWNADGSDGEGFIAHELAEVCPQAVSGEKDAVNEDGSIKPQGIDTSFLVATLTAAIQEQQAIIESLKARLDAANL